MRYLLLAFSLLSFSLFSQNTDISGVINTYEKVTAVDTCTGQLLVDNNTAFPVSTRILMIQMQGAVMNESNSTGFGDVLNIRSAGFYEINEVDSLAAGQIFLKNRLLHDYNGNGSIQILDYPLFSNATVTDTLMPKPWDGTTGGVLAFEVSGNLTLNAPICADKKGFRGGLPFVAANNNCSWLLGQNDYSYSAGSWRGANKGEGIVPIINGKELGRGAQTIGGGGGNDHNSGGGGGGNRVDGGRGGQNDEPATFGCDGDFPGIGGKGIDMDEERIFMGGGGGAGHANNNPVGTGGTGGGILFIKANEISGNTSISALGGNGASVSGDGGGGGGGGGSILLFANNISSNIDVLADGGLGGTTRSGQARCLGPGGGGAGGYLRTNLVGLAAPNGAVPGTVVNTSANCLGQSMGAANGQNGQLVNSNALAVATIPYNSNLPIILENPNNLALCSNEIASFSCLAGGPITGYQWQRWTGSAWVNIPNSSPFSGVNSADLTITPLSIGLNDEEYRCVVSFGNCAPNLETTSATLQVEHAPTVQFAFTYMPGNTVPFTNLSQNFDVLLWEFGDGMTSMDLNPIHTYTMDGQYTVTLTVWNGCDTVMNSEVLSFVSLPLANFAVPDTLSACGSVSQLFSSQSIGVIDNQTWSFPNANPSTSTQSDVNVSFSSSGNYTATLIVENAAGKDTLTRDFYVDIQPLPTAQFQYTTMGGTLLFSNLSMNTTGQLWDFGDASASFDAAPSHSYTNDGMYTVILTTWNDCDTVMTSQIIDYVALPTALFTVGDTIADCNSVSYEFSSESTGAVTSIQWLFPNANPSTSTQAIQTVSFPQSGQYEATLIVENVGGKDTLTQSFYVEILQFPTADFDNVASDNIVQFFNESIDYEDVSWNFGDGSPSVVGIENPLHTYGAIGDYVVTLSVSNSCGASVLQQTISITDLVSIIDLEQCGIRLYPNPTNGLFYIDAEEAKELPLRVRIYSANGSLVFEKNKQFGVIESVDLSTFPQGMYMLRVLFEDAEVGVQVIRK